MAKPPTKLLQAARNDKSTVTNTINTGVDTQSATNRSNYSNTIADRKARGLSLKQYRFCDSYITSGNATQAAIEAGYSEHTAGQMGDENLKKPKMQAEIDRLTAIKEKEQQESTEARGISFTLEDIDREILGAITMAKDKGDTKALASLLTLAARRRGGLLDRSETKDTTDYGDALQEAISRADHQRDLEAERRRMADIHNQTNNLPIRDVGAA
jgi:phage terminase small subunit